MYDTSSWFQVQLEDIASEPVRKFSIGTSDYSNRVQKWPRIKRTMNDVKSLKVTMPVENVDGHFNSFYEDVYTIPNTGTLQMGFETPEAGTIIPQDNIDILHILDDCGDTSTITDWAEAYDGLNPVDNQVYVKEGSHSMALGIDADKDAEDVAVWTNNQSQGDLSVYEHDWIYIWIYFSTLNYLRAAGVALIIRIGSVVGNRIGKEITKAELTAGWNLIKFDLDNPDEVVGTIDWSSIGYASFGLYEVADNTNDFTIYVDSIMFVKNRECRFDNVRQKSGACHPIHRLSQECQLQKRNL